MINKVTFTLKGDYYEMTMSRGEGSRFVEMQFHYHNGCRYASFELEDFKKALAILEQSQAAHNGE